MKTFSSRTLVDKSLITRATSATEFDEMIGDWISLLVE